jgi:hypothetical protein
MSRPDSHKFYPVRVLGEEFDSKFKDLHRIISEDLRLTTDMLQEEIRQSVADEPKSSVDAALYIRVERLESNVSTLDGLAAKMVLVESSLLSKSDINHTHLPARTGIPSPVTITSADSPYSALPRQIILADTSGGAITIDLPPAATVSKWPVGVKVIDATNSVTIDGYASQNIDGATTMVLSTLWDNVMLFTNGVDWFDV